MRCGKARRLIEAYVDGRLPVPLAEEMELHLESCARCGLRTEAARLVAATLAEPLSVRAPEGFAERVMNAVYKAALAGTPEPEHVGRQARIPLRSFRRMGFSFVLTAAVLSVSLFIPAVAYPRLVVPEEAAASMVKNMMNGAGSVVRGALRSADTRMTGDEGGNTK